MIDKMVRTGHWGQERRLEFIDFRLLWEGRLNRADITTFFRISVPQASLDLAKYQEIAPRNMVYDRTQKAYVTTPDFKPVFSSFDSNHYLNELLGRDFVLGRFFNIIEFVSPPTSIPQDVDWNTFIDVVIGPNPNYDTNRRLSIEHDYQMVHGEAKIRIRKAQLYYLNRRLNLDVKIDSSIDDKQQIIMLRIEKPEDSIG